MAMMRSNIVKARGGNALRLFGFLACFALTGLTPAVARAQTDDGMATTPPPADTDTSSIGVDASSAIAAPVAGIPPAAAARGALDIRMGQLESELRAMTGKLEVLQHQVQLLQDDKSTGASSDQLLKLEARINALEQKQLTTPEPAAATTDSGIAASSTGSLTQPDKTAPAAAVDYTSSTKTKTLGTLSQSSAGGATAATPDSPDSAYAQALGQYKAGKYDAARASLQAFLAKYPKHPLAGNAQFWTGETWYAQGAYDKAAKAFAQDYQAYPQSPKAPDALLKLGMSLNAQGKKAEACLTYVQLKKQFPIVSQNMTGLKAESAKAGCK